MFAGTRRRADAEEVFNCLSHGQGRGFGGRGPEDYLTSTPLIDVAADADQSSSKFVGLDGQGGQGGGRDSADPTTRCPKTNAKHITQAAHSHLQVGLGKKEKNQPQQ